MSKSSRSLASVATIEGASGTGKTTLLRGLASRYDCAIVEVGVVVRALAWWAHRHRIPIRDAIAVLAALDSQGTLLIAPTDSSGLAAMDLVLDGRPVGAASFTPQLTQSLSAATIDADGMAWVHAFVRERLRGCRAAISGRDVSVRTFPGARLAVRLEADPSVRRARKLKQLQWAGLGASWRDDIGLMRPPGPDVLRLDTTFLSPAEVINRVGEAAESRLRWIRSDRRLTFSAA